MAVNQPKAMGPRPVNTPLGCPDALEISPISPVWPAAVAPGLVLGPVGLVGLVPLDCPEVPVAAGLVLGPVAVVGLVPLDCPEACCHWSFWPGWIVQ